MRHSVACCALLVLLGGCGTHQESLLTRKPAVLTNDTSGKVHVVWSQAREDREQFVVSGVVRRDDTVGLPIRMTVDVSIVSSDGRVRDRAQSDDIRVPRRITGKVQRFQRFEVSFPARPPEGASIHLAVREG